MRDHDGMLSFRPNHPPEPRSTIRFPLTYRGQLMEIEIGVVETRYTLREGERIALRHDDEVIELTRDNPTAVRANVR
jgi:alpha,alpha-trehalose phosphorylase